MNTFSSNAEEIKFYIRELLNDGEEKSTQDIIGYVKSTSPAGETFTDGMLSGAINDLMSKEKKNYCRIKRGIYKKVFQESNKNNDEFDLIIKNAIFEIEEARKIDIENLTTETLIQKQEKSNRIIRALKELLNS